MKNKYIEIVKPKTNKAKAYSLIVGIAKGQIESLDKTKLLVKLPRGNKKLPLLFKGATILTRLQAMEKHVSLEYQLPFKSTDT